MDLLVKTLFVFTLLICFWGTCYSYKILVLGPVPAMSHYILSKGIADTLHEKGHDITFVSCYSSKNPIYREIVRHESHSLINNTVMNFKMSKRQPLMSFFNINTWVSNMIKFALENKDLKALMHNKNEKFDLVIIEYFHNEAFYGFGIKYNCPIIVLTPVGIMNSVARDTGNPVSPATVPSLFLEFSKEMNLLQRTKNILATISQELFQRFSLNPTQKALYEKYFPEETNIVGFYDLHKRIGLVFTNSHPSIGVSRPLLPNVIEIGGYFIEKSKPLPDDYKNIFDNAKHGVIYFSMGSNLKSSQLPEKVRYDILKTFSKMKQTILWKFESDLPGKPDNVFIRSWMPQSSILAHPKVRLFITHGGLLSTTEAAATGVPVLSIPIFGDQDFNSKMSEQRGTGLRLEFSNLTETSLTWALRELLENPKYKEAAKKTYKLFHDRPVHPKDMLSFYVNHVIKTGGAQHLKIAELNILSSLLLDVFAILIILPLILMTIIVWLCKKCWKKTEKVRGKRKIKRQ